MTETGSQKEQSSPSAENTIFRIIGYVVDIIVVLAFITVGAGLWWIYFRYVLTRIGTGYHQLPQIAGVGLLIWIVISILISGFGYAWLTIRCREKLEKKIPALFRFKIPFLLFIILVFVPLILMRLNGD
jgi:hypothetical protein